MFEDWVCYKLAKKTVLIFRAMVFSTLFFFSPSVSAAEKNRENVSMKAALIESSIN